MLYFEADYNDRELLKKLGAGWDFKSWRWFVKKPEDYRKFSPWLKGRITCDRLYFLERKVMCPFCKKSTNIIALGIGGYRENFLPEVYGKDSVNILYGFENVSEEIAKYLRENYSVSKKYNIACGYKYLTNGCTHCQKAFADEYLFGDITSPFYIDGDSNEPPDVRLIDIGHDILIDGMVKWSFARELFKDIQTVKKYGLKL